MPAERHRAATHESAIWGIALLGLLGPSLGLLAGCPARIGGEPTAAQATPGRPGETPALSRSPGLGPVPGAGSPGSASPASVSPAASPAPNGPDALVAIAREDAAGRAGVAPSAVRLVRVEPREWPDRSLGCPQPGMGYAQAITPGYLIVLEAAGRELEYHSDRAQVILCER